MFFNGIDLPRRLAVVEAEAEVDAVEDAPVEGFTAVRDAAVNLHNTSPTRSGSS
jgi:hypothetical protein